MCYTSMSNTVMYNSTCQKFLWWFEWSERGCILNIVVCDDVTYPSLFGFVNPPLSYSASFSVLASSCSTIPVTTTLSTHCFQLLASYLLIYLKKRTQNKNLQCNVWYSYKYTCNSISVRNCLLRHYFRKYYW